MSEKEAAMMDSASITFTARFCPDNDGYAVTTSGEVFSRKYGRWKKAKPSRNTNGYIRAGICLGDGRRKSKDVHRLVLEAFVGPGDGLEACHGNGIKDDNRLENLRWATSQENSDDKHRHGTMAHGERQGCAKLTDAQVIEMRRLFSIGNTTIVELANRFQISDTTAAQVLHRQSWRHLPSPDKGGHRSVQA